jgi:hypothetical protein
MFSLTRFLRLGIEDGTPDATTLWLFRDLTSILRRRATISCTKFVTHIADALIDSGEIAQRVSENKERPAAGPAVFVIHLRTVGEARQGVDVIVHSNTHPVMGPHRDSGMPPPIFYRQSTTSDLGAMAQRVGAKHLVLTHMTPPPSTPT